MNVMAVSDAARRLGVSTRQVQHLVAQGELRQVARGLVDASSVERHLAVRAGSHVRGWSEPTAWGAVALLSGVDAGWMGGSQRWRLARQLRGMTSSALVVRARVRAKVTRHRAHASAGPRLVRELVTSSDLSGVLGLAPSRSIDGYLAASGVDAVVHRHGLIVDDLGWVTLRATSMDLVVVGELVRAGVFLTALDFAGSLDVRERRAGLERVDEALERFRG